MTTVLVVEWGTPALRGRITRWMLEVHAGVCVGTIGPRVREELWKAVCERIANRACLLIHSSPGEQGFTIKTYGQTARTVLDLEGLTLACRS